MSTGFLQTCQLDFSDSAICIFWCHLSFHKRFWKIFLIQELSVWRLKVWVTLGPLGAGSLEEDWPAGATIFSWGKFGQIWNLSETRRFSGNFNPTILIRHSTHRIADSSFTKNLALSHCKGLNAEGIKPELKWAGALQNLQESCPDLWWFDKVYEREQFPGWQ